MLKESFAQYGIDVPNGRAGEIDVPCPECSPTRKKKKDPCLSVNTDEGTWFCHHCGWAGGLKRDDAGRIEPVPKVYSRPKPFRASELSEKAVRFLKGRGITPTVAHRNRLSTQTVFMPQCGEQVSTICFPYYRDGELVNAKYRDGRKHFRMEKGAERILFGLDDIDPTATIIVEGELDKLSCETAGWPNCVSVPDGAPTPDTKNYSNKFEFLDDPRVAAVELWVIAVDGDEPGKRLSEELCRRFGREKCRLVEWPEGCKDANEVLKNHGAEALSQVLAEAKPIPIEGVFTAEDLSGDIDKLYDDGLEKGVSTGWPCLDDYYTVRPGEFTVVTGIPNSGKSNWLDALTVNLARDHGWNFAMFSPENQPLSDHMARIIEKYVGRPFHDGPTQRMSRDTMDIARRWVSQHFRWILPSDDAEWTIDAVLERAAQLVYQYGIRGLVIDPWNEMEHLCPADQTETQYISQSLKRIRQFGRRYGVHVWIVVHPTKLRKNERGDYPVPTLYDCGGCHSEDTDVLTRTGWKAHADVTKDDWVACFDLETETIRYEKPSKVWVYNYQGPMYRFRSPSYDALVTPNHRMVVRPSWADRHQMIGSGLGRPVAYDRDGWTFKHADEVAGDLEMPWATPCVDGDEIKFLHGMPADPALRLIGWYVAEGWTDSASRVGICQGVGELADRMRSTLVELGIDFSESVNKPGTGGSINTWQAWFPRRKNADLCDWLSESCGKGSANKRLPDIVWTLSARQKSLLLEALIEGDGSKGRGDTFKYSTVSRRLADDVQRLSIECGRMAGVSYQATRSPGHRDQYQINIGRQDRRRISLRKSRNVTTEQYSGRVYCLTVPTGAYVVRRNGKPGIYGNSAHWRNKADNGVCVWRDLSGESSSVDVHIQKIRFRQIGRLGMSSLNYEKAWSGYTDPSAPREVAM